MSEPECSQGVRGARRVDRPAAPRGGAGVDGAPAGLFEERTECERVGAISRRQSDTKPHEPASGPRDSGTAVVEFVLLGVVLLVPLLYLVLALSAVQRTVYGVTQAAREAGRAYVTGTAATAPARADQAARLALADQGLPAEGVEIRYGGADSGCGAAGPQPWPLRPGVAFAICVRAPLRVPAVPGFLVADRTTVTARHVVRADEHRDYTP